MKKDIIEFAYTGDSNKVLNDIRVDLARLDLGVDLDISTPGTEDSTNSIDDLLGSGDDDDADLIGGSITSPQGFQAAARFCNLKKIGTGKGSNKGEKKDLALIFSEAATTSS